MILYRKISGDTKCEIPIRKIIVIDMIIIYSRNCIWDSLIGAMAF